MGDEKLAVIMAIARRGGLLNTAKATTGMLASELSVSQQTVSRWLTNLESQGLISRKSGKIGLTQNGRDMLVKLRDDLTALFEKSKKELGLTGRVISGMHEGRFYLSIPEYKKQIAKALGFEVFPGTLNLKLEGVQNADGKRRLMGLAGIEIRGFKKNGRVLGGAKVFRAKIDGKKGGAFGAAIIPAKSHYGADILEIISKENLRRLLSLKNKDEVGVTIEL
ncbi:MAG: DUF120 domain-containing protein [Candidatus Micrarchaeota archaeon]